MTYSGFERKLNKSICNMLNGHRQFNMYNMITDFGHMLEYDVINIFLRYKDKYVLKEGYHGVINWKFSYTTFGYSIYGLPFQK